MDKVDEPSDTAAIESHSYDYVPESQRHGTARGQTPFWFMINATLITAFTGAIGPVAGLSLTWTIVALVAGTVFGTFFQAFHAAQGPTMGLPQMIQSRVQFGTRGSVLPLLAVTFVQLGFGIFYVKLASDSLGQVTTPAPKTFELAVLAIGIVLAIVGHNLLHRVERWLSILMLINLVLITVAVVVETPFLDLFATGTFAVTAFLAQFGASAAYQIAIAPIVSDYTRYLPKTTGTKAVVLAVFGGTMASAVWLETVGAVLATALPQSDLIAAIATTGDALFGGLGTATLVLAALVTTSVLAVGLYSGSVTLLSMVEAFRPFRSTQRIRVITLVLVGVVVYAGCVGLPEDFLTNFNAFLAFLLYFLIPWTAVNLVDFYFVRRGRYSVTDILLPAGGIYGKWGVTGMICYALGFVVMIPFFSTALYVGPIAEYLGGADIAPIVGLAVASVSYLLLMRRQDLTNEMAAVSLAPINTHLTSDHHGLGAPAPLTANSPSTDSPTEATSHDVN